MAGAAVEAGELAGAGEDSGVAGWLIGWNEGALPALAVLLAPEVLAERDSPGLATAGEPELVDAGVGWPTLAAEPLDDVEVKLLAPLEGVDAPADVEGDGTAEEPVPRPPGELPDEAYPEFPGVEPIDGAGRGVPSVGAPTVCTACWPGAATAGLGCGLARLRLPIVCMVTVGVGGVAASPFADGDAGARGAGMASAGACHTENAGISAAIASTSAVLTACCART